MGSVWSNSCNIPKREHLENDLETNTVVIGAGMAGILTAYQLQKKGVDTVVLEAKEIASGQTKNTTAKITSQHGIIYTILEENFGKEKTVQYAHANQQAIQQYADIIDELQISCDFEWKNAYIYSKNDASLLKKEATAARFSDIPAKFITQTPLPFPVQGAVVFENQAQFNPLQFIQKIAEKITVYENTPVSQVKKDTVFTSGHKIKAKNIVFATHFPFINIPGYYFMRMHQERSYVIAFEQAAQLEGMFISIDGGGLSFRNYKDLLFVGGGNHKTGENKEGGKYDVLLARAKELFPQAVENTRWSAQDCMTLDCVPYIGRYSSGNNNWYVATGFMKWGMTSSMVAADIISDYICGAENENAQVFSPQRFTASSVPPLVDNGLEAIKGLSKENFNVPPDVLDKIAPGHGGIVDIHKKKAGVYKDENGEIYVVSSRCPHMGCQLEWNPDEKSWDCPCHGSRFDYTGKLIDNPAQKGIQ